MQSILLVDDDAKSRELGKKVLERRGYQVTVASDGEEALEAAASGRFDLVLMDIEMPKMNGHDTLHALRARRPELPVVAVSARVTEADRLKCEESGFDDFLAKPYQLDALRAVVDVVVAHPSHHP